MDRNNAVKQIDYALSFTEAYKSIPKESKAEREAKCLELQVPFMLVGINDDDLIAGMMKHGIVGMSPQYGGIYTYFFNKELFDLAYGAIEQGNSDYKSKALEMYEFWKTENTLNKLAVRFESEFGFRMPASLHEPGAANADGRLAGTNIDFDKLIKNGLNGMLKEVNDALIINPESADFFNGLIAAIGTIKTALSIYEKQATEKIASASSERKQQLQRMADALYNVQNNKPATFLEGLQLFWVYSVVSDLMNYGRMDVYLGDLYANDIDTGVITEEEAIEYIQSLYRHFKTIGKIHDCRIIVGGLGRRNECNADRLAIAIMETSRRFKDTVPQLTLRYYKGMNEEVFDKAMEVNAEGCTFPIIYSDDTNVPAVMKCFGITKEEAYEYVPFGCGEYVLQALSVGTPNNGINLLKALEIVLHNGTDMFHKVKISGDVRAIEEYKTFNDLWQALSKHLDECVKYAAFMKLYNYQVANEQASYLYYSLLMNDCIKRGKALLDGGVRYFNASSEVFGIISCADSLTAIKKYVYDEKKFTLSELVKILDNDFEMYEAERKLLLNAPKYGNDNNEADKMATDLFSVIAEKTSEYGKIIGLDNYNIVSVNNSMSAEWGYYCTASACGRKSGYAMSNGNGPSLGADKSGVTALLNSMSKFDNTNHVGVINNIRFSKEMFNESREKVKFALKTFYENNGVQTNICVIGKDDLVNAKKHPENYKNLIVRIGGFSARFVELSDIVQTEIINRTTY